MNGARRPRGWLFFALGSVLGVLFAPVALTGDAGAQDTVAQDAIPQDGGALDIGALLEQVRVTPPDRVAFRELRSNSLLKEPLQLTGYLEYLERGKMRKVVESPFQESLLVDGDAIEMVRDGKTRRLSLRNRKPALVMLQSIESLLSGDAVSLDRYFEPQLSGTEEEWRLQLTPTSTRLAKRLSGLTVSGGRHAIDSIRFEMQDGEWQLLQILHDGGGDPQ